MPENNPILWGDNPRPITSGNLTPFAYYDTDTHFQNDAPRVAKWVCARLGYPTVDIELMDTNIYACFEEAISTYGSEVNLSNIKNNLLSLKGYPTGSQNLNNRQLKPRLGNVIQIAQAYGAEVGSGGDVPWYSGSITVNANQQTYDLSNFIASESIEIKKVFHFEPPAITRYFDPMAGTGIGTNYMMQEFGWELMSPAVNFMLMPMYEDVLRLQAIEFNSQIRRSAYGFQIVNNVLKLFPVPTTTFTLWFNYVKVDERNNPVNSRNGLITDISDVPYTSPTYAYINNPGKAWIRHYTLALVKEMLGAIRGKYSTIPSSGDPVQLDGDTLRNEATNEKNSLLEQLRKMLDDTGPKALLEARKDETEAMQNIIKNSPLGIYIG